MSDLQEKMIEFIKPWLKKRIEEESLNINVDNITLDDIKKIKDILKFKSNTTKKYPLHRHPRLKIVDYELLEFILEDKLNSSHYEKLVRMIKNRGKSEHTKYSECIYGIETEEDLDNLTEYRKRFFLNILKCDYELPNNYFLQSVVFSEALEQSDSVNYKYGFLYGLVAKRDLVSRKLKINVHDFYNMIVKYEESGDRFNIDELKSFYSRFVKLITTTVRSSDFSDYYNHYRTYYGENNSWESFVISCREGDYFDCHYLDEEDDDYDYYWFNYSDNSLKLLEKIQEEYRNYKRDNIVFTVQDFVDFYNQKYNDDVSKLVGSNHPMLLNERFVRYFCEKDNRFSFVGVEGLLSKTRSGKYYEEKILKDYSNALKEENTRNHFINFYDLKIKNMGTVKKQTLGYFLLKNIPERHWELFSEMIRYKKYRDFYNNFCNLSVDDYRYVADQLEADFISELEKANVNQFVQIFEKYVNYIKLYNVERVYDKYELTTAMHRIIRKREKDISIPFVKNCLALMDGTINLYEAHLHNEKFYCRLETRYNFDIVFGESVDNLFDFAKKIDPSLEVDISIVKERYYNDKQKYALEQEKISQKLNEYKNSSLILAAKTIVQLFVDSVHETVKWFCIKENVDSSYFSNCLEIVKENDSELYEKYYSKVLKHKQEKYAAVMGNARQIVDKIINGVEKPDGTFRPFSYLDYKLTTTNDFDAFMDLVKNMKDLTKEQLIAVRKFVKSNESKASMNNKEFMEGSYTFKLPDGSSYTATIEDKEKVLQFLKSKELLSTDYKLLRLTLRGHVLGELDIDEEIKKNDSGNKSL